MIRKLQPKVVINNRGYDEGDFGTPERDYDKGGEELPSFEKRIEACQSVGAESWGYRKGEDYYADRHLLRSIVKYLARDANYLLNVGPQGDGAIPDEAAAILRRIGKWYRAVKESLEGTTSASWLTANRNVLLTRRATTSSRRVICGCASCPWTRWRTRCWWRSWSSTSCRSWNQGNGLPTKWTNGRNRSHHALRDGFHDGPHAEREDYFLRAFNMQAVAAQWR
jgi:hypothetical protein